MVSGQVLEKCIKNLESINHILLFEVPKFHFQGSISWHPRDQHNQVVSVAVKLSV